MGKNFTKLAAYALLSFLLILSGKANATHSMGMDIVYTCANDSDYTFELHLYRDCGGVPAPGSVTLNVNSTSCGISTTILLSLVSSVEVSDLCPAQLPNSECNGGTINGVEKYTYSGTYFDMPFCTDWVFDWTLCCRNGADIDNISGSPAEYVETKLDNSSGTCNNSPVFASNSVPYFCKDQCFSYHNGAYDADGDSLVYSMVDPLSNSTTSVPWGPGYSATQPFDTTGGGTISFDSTTGLLQVCIYATGVFIVTIKVDEYRDGVLIGEIRHDLQFIIRACTNEQPTLSDIDTSAVTYGATQTDPITSLVCPGDSLSFQIIGADVDVSDNLSMTTNLASSIPNATWSTSGSNPITGTISWVPSGSDIGWHFFTVKVEDGACEANGTVYNVFIIKVLDGTTVTGDPYFCPIGDSATLIATGGTVFTWSPAAGLSSTTGSTVEAAPAVTTTYTVVSNISGGCDSIDSITVTVVSDFTIAMSADSDTICMYGASILSATPTPAGSYTYVWTSGTNLSTTSTSNPIATPLTTETFYVTVTSDSGCKISDSVSVMVSGVAPQVTATASDDTICPNDTVNLYGVVAATVSNCGVNAVCAGSPVTSTVGAGTLETSVAPFYGSYPLLRIQSLYDSVTLAAAGITQGTITEIAWNISKQYSTVAYNDFQISIGCTGATSLTTGGWETVTLVYGPTTLNGLTTGWNTFILNTPYDWSGSLNLVVQVCYKNIASGSSVADRVYATSGISYTSTMRAYQDTDTLALCDIAPAWTYTSRPNTRFTICSPTSTGVTYSWTPTGDLYSSSSTLPDTLPNPQAILGSTTTFLVTVSDGSCDGSDFVTVVIDNSVTVTATATPDTMTTCGIDTSWLLAVITGSPLTPDPLACGTNGTSLTGLTIDSGAVGTDVTTTAAYGPYQAILMVDERIQYLYRASDLTAISMLDGTITRVGWNVDAKLSTYDFTGFTISMGCTSASTLSNSAWETTTVVYGPASVSTTASAWNMYTLDNPYDWDGSSNVVVEVCWDRSTYACANPVGICGDQIVYTDVGGSNSYSMKREAGGFPTISDSTGCSMVSTGASVSSYRPNTRFVFYNASNVGAWVFAWTPTATVDIPSDSSTFAIPTVETTYTVDVTGGLCAVRDSVTVYCPLPIKLVKFDGKNIGDVIALNWVTLTEINNDYFDILRSRDGEIFTKIGVIKANGNSTTRKDYEFLDGDPYIGINYYKLEQVDYNKSVESSNIIAIEYLPAVVTISNVYPNPADDAINYVVVLPVDGKIHVDVVDPYGRTILTDKLNLSRGQHVLTMDLENISEGLYFLRVRDEKNSDSGYQKFIKK